MTGFASILYEKENGRVRITLNRPEKLNAIDNVMRREMKAMWRSLPYDDETFDLVVGHAVLHHIPDVELAMREVLRVLKPGGRFVFAGEPTQKGDWVARRLSRLTWWAASRATHLPPFRERWARPRPLAGTPPVAPIAP